MTAFGWRETLASRLLEIWYGKHPLRLALAPLAWLFRALVWLRRQAYRSGLFTVFRAPVPVIVVGNLTVGGSGKTPLVIWLARQLKDYGYKPGIVARGYRGRASRWPQQVRGDSDPVTVGDEAVVIARRTDVPLAVGPRRSADINALLRYADVDIIVCDDGLQHYALARDLEIAVLDGVRRFGNGLCLPAGPLREPVTRLAEVDLVVTNGLAARGEFAMRYHAARVCQVVQPARAVDVSEFSTTEVHAVAAIGNPANFFALLKRAGLRVTPHAYPDHHRFVRADIVFDDERPVIMTEKDAVKCEHIADRRHWYVVLEAELPEVFERRLRVLLRQLSNGQKTA